MGSCQKVRKPEEYILEICVVLVKEKVKRMKSTGSVPAAIILCNSGDTAADTLLGRSGSRIFWAKTEGVFSFCLSSI